MLPPLERLSLGAATGEFYALPQAEADALNADGGREVLTLDPYKRDRGRDDDGATFRLFWDHKQRRRRNPPGHESAEERAARDAAKYAVYDAEALWEWIKNRPNNIDDMKDPTLSFRLTQDDWMALYEKYDGYSPIPEWVPFLEAVEFPDFGPNTTWVKTPFSADRVAERNRDYDHLPPAVAERLRRNLEANGLENGWAAYVDGALRFKSARTSLSEPPTKGPYYEGPAGEERLVRKEELMPGHKRDWEKYFGPKGQERKIEWHHRGIEVWHWSPDLDPPLPNPPLWHSEGTGRLRRIEFLANHEVWHFKGRAGQERTSRKEKDLTVHGRLTEHYRGGLFMEESERLVNIQYHDTGEIEYFHGPHGHERLWKTTHRDGRVEFFQGSKGHERHERTEFPDGRVEYHDDIEA